MTCSPRSLTAHLKTTASHGTHSCASRAWTEALDLSMRRAFYPIIQRAAPPSEQPEQPGRQ